MEQTERRFAVLIDADNVSPKYIKYILDEASDMGVVTYKRIYGDWTDNAKRVWKESILEWSVNPIQQYSYTVGKNATDSAMIIDAMDILYSGSVQGFCLVSSDSDFTRLAQRLREAGMFVVGMGERKTPKPFVKACDAFKILEVIAQEKEPMNDASGSAAKGANTSLEEIQAEEVTSLEEIQAAVEKIVTENNNKGKPTHIAQVGSTLSKKFSDFDVRNYGCTKLSTFLEGLERVELIQKGSIYFVQNKQATIPLKEVEKRIAAVIEANGGRLDNLGIIQVELKKKYPAFNVKQYGYSRLSSFIRSFPQFKIEGNVVRMRK